MKHILLIFFTLLIFSCQKPSDKSEISEVVEKIENSETKNYVSEESAVDCEGIFKKITLSSNLTALKSYKDIFIRIENVSDTKIVLEIFAKNNQGDRITENTVAWLHFLPDEEKLLDITSDPEDPTELSFDKNILKNNDYRKICGLIENKSENKQPVSADAQCKEIKGTMLRGEECLISATTLEKVYDEIVQKSLVTDANFLLKKLPKTLTKQEINKNGLINITYKPGLDKMDIEMFYEGGITDIHLVKQKQNVKRQIVYNLD